MNEEQRQQIYKNTVVALDQIIHALGSFTGIVDKLNAQKQDLIKILVNNHQNTKKDHWNTKIDQFVNNKESYNLTLRTINDFKSSFENDSRISKLSPQYLNLVHSAITEENINHSIIQTISKINTHMSPEQYNSIPNGANVLVANLNNLFSLSENYTSNITQKIAHFNTFEYVKDITHSVVIIGANGSGKSSFSRNTKKVLGNNVAIISAQKVFAYNPPTTIPIGSSSMAQVHQFQGDDKLGRDNNFAHLIQSDLNNLINSLLAEHNQCASTYYEASKNNETPNRTESKLERVMCIWKKIIFHRSLKLENSVIQVFQNDNKQTYQFTQLSDGEKAVFYYIAHILFTKENSYIIIDEPENHLHLGVVTKLWDTLESERTDCRFIYLTHNLDFASSRINARKLWSKKFTSPAQWDVQLLPEDDELPEKLLMELLGSRRKVLFCEGEKSSPDYKLYSILFPEFTISPVDGHSNVINYTRAYNKSKEIYGNLAIGVIDGDYHFPEAKVAWKKDFIYCIDVQEVENILCDEMLLEAAKIQFLGDDDDCLNNAKQKLIDKLSKDIDEQIKDYLLQRANITLKDNMLNKKEDFKKQLNNLKEKIDIDKWGKERTELLQDIIAKNDYNRALKFYNFKGMVGFVPDPITKDYKERIFPLLESDKDLQTKLKNKYFSEIEKAENLITMSEENA